MSSYVALSQIPSIAETPCNPVTWDFQLPPSVDAERLEVNVDRIKKITKVGYFLGHHIVAIRARLRVLRQELQE